MKKCYIVGSCKDSQLDFTYDDSDYIIASDGGLKFLMNNNYRIDMVVGDFDSLGFKPTIFNSLELPKEKDVTDTHVALSTGFIKGYTDFEVYGCLGGRLDHTIATIQDAYNMKKCGYNITLHSKNEKIIFIKDEIIQLEGTSEVVSIFSYGEIAKGVTIKGLKYELNDKELTNSFPLGVSNEFDNKKATIEVKDGCLMVVINFNN